MKITHLLSILLLSMALILGCNETPPNTTNKDTEEPPITEEPTVQKDTTNIPPFISAIEKTHQKEAFFNKEAIQFDIRLQFRGKERLKGRITTTTNSVVGLLELSTGEKMYVNKDKVFCSAALADKKSVRFDAYTWSYFFLFPYKLSDDGVQWQDLGQMQYPKKTYNPYKLTFAAGTGDDPQDWYIVFADPKSKLIDHAAYIVTANKSQAEAEKDPHAISYSEYKNIDGIPIAHQWTFWEWRKDKGLTKELGSAEIYNVQFVADTISDFSVPASFVEK